MASKEKFVFSKNNILLILAGIGITLIGFILMIGGGSEDPTVFNKEELFSARRITLAPLMVIAGYGLVIFGIMRKPGADIAPRDFKFGTFNTVFLIIGVVKIALGLGVGSIWLMIGGLLAIMIGLMISIPKKRSDQ